MKQSFSHKKRAVFVCQNCWIIVLLALLTGCAESPASAPRLPQVPAATPPAAGIDMRDLQPYMHPSKLFRIAVPRQWQVYDSSTSSEIVVHFDDQAENALIQTNLLTVTQQLDTPALTTLLHTYLAKTYGSNAAFAQQPGNRQPDQTIAATWTYDAALAGGTTARMRGSSMIIQRGACVAVLSFVVPDQQYPALAAQIAAIRASYQLTVVDSPHAVAVAGPLLQTHMDDLQPYTHTDKLFTLNVPAGWSRHDQSAPGSAAVLWTAATGNAWIMVDVLKVDSQRTDKERTALLRKVLTAAFGTQQDFTLGAAEAQDHGRTRMIWTYRAAADNGTAPWLQGTSYIEQHGDKVAIITVTLPMSEAAALQAPRAAIIASFVIDATAPLA